VHALVGGQLHARHLVKLQDARCYDAGTGSAYTKHLAHVVAQQQTALPGEVISCRGNKAETCLFDLLLDGLIRVGQGKEEGWSTLVRVLTARKNEWGSVEGGVAIWKGLLQVLQVNHVAL